MDFNVVRNVPQKQVTFPYENTFATDCIEAWEDHIDRKITI